MRFVEFGGVAPEPGRKPWGLSMTDVTSFAVGATVDRKAAVVDLPRMVESA
jgi:hypothetical protein